MTGSGTPETPRCSVADWGTRTGWKLPGPDTVTWKDPCGLPGSAVKGTRRACYSVGIPGLTVRMGWRECMRVYVGQDHMTRLLDASIKNLVRVIFGLNVSSLEVFAFQSNKEVTGRSQILLYLHL